MAAEVKVVEGFADVEMSHYAYWESIRANDLQLSPYEYEAIPRGRVVMNANKSCFLVYGSSALLSAQSFIKEILEQFALPKERTTFTPDAHYESPSAIN